MGSYKKITKKNVAVQIIAQPTFCAVRQTANVAPYVARKVLQCEELQPGSTLLDRILLTGSLHLFTLLSILNDTSAGTSLHAVGSTFVPCCQQCVQAEFSCSTA
jgi:hypothetical protein